jgi:hypothetical protein
MIYSNKKRMFEVSVRIKRRVHVFPVGASTSEEAENKVMDQYGIRKSQIVEVSK